MSKNKERVIKIMRDGRFHAMRLIVNTFDEAVDRCTKKGQGNYFLDWPGETVLSMKATAGVCGTPQYLRQYLS